MLLQRLAPLPFLEVWDSGCSQDHGPFLVLNHITAPDIWSTKMGLEFWELAFS